MFQDVPDKAHHIIKSMSKQQYRSEMGIMGDILDVTMDGGQQGVIVSAISRRANLSHYSVLDKCEKLISAGLMESRRDERNRLFKITEKGLGFIKEFQRFQTIVDSMNLRYYAMNLQQIVAQKHQSPGGEMLLVGNTDILSAMVRIPIVVIGLVVVALSIPIQQSLGSSRTLDFTIYSDGSTHVFYELETNPLEPEFSTKLFGTTLENLTIIDNNGFLLSYETVGDSITIETLGASHIFIDYDTQELVSKTGKIWKFSVDSSSEYSLLMPNDSVIVEMNNFPISMEVENEQSRLVFTPGQTNISYYISTLASAQVAESISEDGGTDNSSILWILGGVVSSIVIAAAIIVIKRKTGTPKSSVIIQKDEEPKLQSLDPESIFKAKQDLREDDKEIINFISANGGQVFESELRKKFLQPRTTMWRAVKRLERHGIIEIVKKDFQNVIKLRSTLEDDS